MVGIEPVNNSNHFFMEETAYLLRSSKNAARLAEAIEEIEAGKARERTLSE